ncbi:Archaeal primase DnaG/twinkle, TOPRIM domain [uncultured Caudovirales phage]|uniref:Archaeal primase DnaG/twinkle, TOPRIM domain n=1 Tax=uncultured Caudovirales phage TaxID=2100421 RepID=A0A6J5MBH1_9CAUD|nr:Archaeal primase DnaG/twinkle, TOPRIM domain [uncultured Caudovirales phage]
MFEKILPNLNPKPNGECDTLCPFPHDKGYETRPSAHINLDKRVFHCKTCQAERRFEAGGLSETGFVAEYYGISYEQAANLMATMNESENADDSQWNQTCALLHDNVEYMEYLRSRGLTTQTIKKYQLGYSGDGIMYPVFIYGQLCDVRTYMPDQTPKMRSRKGASPLLFPFDEWLNDERDTLLCAGENDTLLARQLGFNAVTVTGGEGTFPKIFAKLFEGKNVNICYDCDDAGKRGARTVAFLLKEIGANVRLVDLGLEGTKESKDVTDFITKCNRTAEDLYTRIQAAQTYSEELFKEDKNIAYPVVNLWDIAEGKYAGKRISARVLLSGKYDMPMQTPTAIEWECNNPNLMSERSPCQTCPYANKNGWWTLNENLKDVMELVDVNDKQQDAAINKFIGLPAKCPGVRKTVKARKPVYKVIFTPDVPSEEGEEYRAIEQYAYTVGLNLEDGQRYRVFFKPYAHSLDGQRVYMVVDRVEESDNAINSFEMTDEIAEQLKVFQGDPFNVMSERAEQFHNFTKIFKPNPMIANAVDLMYHSPLRFKFHGREMKGYPEILIVGESRTGKTETGLMFQRYVGIGNFMALKGATTAGILGGADKLTTGGFKINWGTVPRNNKGLVIMDELSGMSREVMASLTAMRSERIATVHKITRGKAPAETRLLWCSNPRVNASGQSTNIKDYPTGVHIMLDLIGSDEDIARFDMCMLIVKESDSSPLDTPQTEAYDSEIYANLIKWVWTRNSDEVIFDNGVEEYIVQIASELNEKYDTDIKLFGAECWKKIARIATACAACTFSCTPNFNSIVVTKRHVDWAADFFRRNYDNSIFRLGEYVRERRSYNETNEAVNTLVAGICRSNAMLIKTLLNSVSPVPMGNLMAVSGLERNQFAELVNRLSSNFLVTVNPSGLMATRRLRLAVDVYRSEYPKSRLLPLSQEGSVGV